MTPAFVEQIRDPIKYLRWLWPDVAFYAKQQEIIYSVRDNPETIVPAGHQLGKDFVAGAIALGAFLAPQVFLDAANPSREVRVVTTSVKDDHLRVLFGEIGRFIDSAKYPLRVERGGPLLARHREIRKVTDGMADKISYLVGTVSETGEGLSGHHAAHTLLICDEASGCHNMVYDRGVTWAKRLLVIGNPYPAGNFFEAAVKEGPRCVNGKLQRNIIRVQAADSPNVRERRHLIPGVLTHEQYQERLATWDAIRVCVGLHAEFYSGPENLMFPPEVLNRCEEIAEDCRGRRRFGKSIGIDPGEGGDKTAWVVIDECGILEVLSLRTPDTSVIQGQTLALMRKWRVPAVKVCFDRGGGGYEHACQLRADGYGVQTVSFGGAVSPEPRRGSGQLPYQERVEQREERYAYKDKRAELYGNLKVVLERGFGIPREYAELRRQLAPIPLKYDGAGRMLLLPKTNPNDPDDPRTLVKLIGHSPDEADAFALSCFVLFGGGEQQRPHAGSIFHAEESEVESGQQVDKKRPRVGPMW